MARGWESKEVESQQAQAEESMRTRKMRLTTEQLERNARIHLLELDVARIEREMAAATHPRRVAQLQAALDFVHEKIRQLG
jgi:hypothetical protein